MEGRIVMNSSSLQSLFSEEYGKFFSKNNLIVSCPHVINRWNVTHLEGIKAKIAQKMPTKLYVGINIRKDSDIQLKTITRFLQFEQKFEEIPIEMEWDKEILSKMKDAIKTKLLEYGVSSWIEISIFSENQRWTGATLTSTTTMLLSFIIHILAKKISLQEVADYNKFMRSKIFLDVYSTAKKMMESISPVHKKHINSTVQFAACIHNSNVWMWLDSRQYLDSLPPSLMKIDHNFCLRDFTNPKRLLDYSIINFWCFFNGFYNTETYLNTEKEYIAILKHYKMDIPVQSSLCIDVVNFLYLELFKSAKEALNYPNDERIVNHFFVQVNRLWSHQTFIEKYMDLYRDIVSTFKKNMTFEDEKIWLIPISSAKPWGTFLCLTKTEKSRETLKKVLYDLQNTWHTTARFQYLSWEDGICEDGLKIEQYLNEGCFSSYIKDGDALLECGCWSKISCWQKIIWNHRKLLDEVENWLVFDDIDGKIYINNALTTHNEILTQSGTVDIIKMLFDHMWSYVHNSQLPPSSYSKNKNEMVGKIICPLQELVQKKFDKKLDLKCTWNIVDFDLRLVPNEIPIYFLKKIH